MRVRAIKFEFDDRKVIHRGTNQIIDINGVIEEPFLSFYKAWINVMFAYKKTNSMPYPESKALKALESSLRRLHNDNSPWLIDEEALLMAERMLKENLNESSAYEASMHLEMLVGMLQFGYKSRVYNFNGAGFNLLIAPIDFKCSLKDRVRKTALEITSENILHNKEDERLTHIELATVGLTYRKSKNLHGNKSYLTYYAALSAVASIISVRPTEVLNLTIQSLSFDDENQRFNIFIYRAKIGTHQSIPVPRIFSEIIQEIFETLIEFTHEARAAVTFYFDNWKQINDIDRLYNEEFFDEGIIDGYISCKFLYNAFFQNTLLVHFLNGHLKKSLGLTVRRGIVVGKKLWIIPKKMAAKCYYRVEEVRLFCESNDIPNTLQEIDNEFLCDSLFK